MRRTLLTIAFVLLGFGVRAGSVPPELVAPTSFAYYVLALSWSPGFCDTSKSGQGTEQCTAHNGTGFVTHGLWPNNDTGAYLQFCSEQDAQIPTDALAYATHIYPSQGLAVHEWRKHGTCTGLNAAAYFHAVQYARDQIVVPEALRAPSARLTLSTQDIIQDFLKANPRLTKANVAIACEQGELVEVRVCIAHDLGSFVSCPKVTSRSCQSNQIAVAPVR